MRVALISFISVQDKKAVSIVKKLEVSALSRGNQVEVFNGFENMVNTRLTAFDYITVVLQSKGLFGAKISPRVSEFLATSGSVSGKKGCAMVLKYGFSSEKTCRNLMKIMEKEGLKLDYFEVIQNEESAYSAGKKIG